MNRLKKIFSSLSDIGIVPPSSAIRRAWGIVRTALDAHAPVVGSPGFRADSAEQYSLAVKLIDRIVGVVIAIAEDAEKPSDKAQVGQ